MKDDIFHSTDFPCPRWIIFADYLFKTISDLRILLLVPPKLCFSYILL